MQPSQAQHTPQQPCAMAQCLGCEAGGLSGRPPERQVAWHGAASSGFASSVRQQAAARRAPKLAPRSRVSPGMGRSLCVIMLASWQLFLQPHIAAMYGWAGGRCKKLARFPRSSTCASSLLQGWPHWSCFPQGLHRVLSAEVEQDFHLHGCVPGAHLGFAARVVLSDGGCLPASSSEATRGLHSKEHPAWKSAEAMTTWRSR